MNMELYRKPAILSAFLLSIACWRPSLSVTLEIPDEVTWPTRGTGAAVHQGIQLASNPSAVIRAANRIIQCGRGELSEVIREVVTLHDDKREAQLVVGALVDPPGRYYRTPFYATILTSFEPTSRPPPFPWKGLEEEAEHLRVLSKTFPVFVVQDIPVVVPDLVFAEVAVGHTLAIRRAEEYVEWSRNAARLRHSLNPPENPIRVIESWLLETHGDEEWVRRLTGDVFREFRRQVIWQGIRALEGAIDEELVTMLQEDTLEGEWPWEAAWRCALEISSRTRIVWNRELQRYVAKRR